MKRLYLTLLLLVSTVCLANAQMIRPSGVVRKTKVKIEREKTNGSWADEIGRWTHSAGALAGSDWDDVMLAVDYTLQYRFNPLLSAGFGAWCGVWCAYEDFFGIDLRANLKIHPLANIKPDSRFQPYVALWGDIIIPNNDSKNSMAEYGTDVLAGTAELGCDIYGSRFPIYISLNLNIRNDYGEYEWDVWDELVYSVFLKGGIKF